MKKFGVMVMGLVIVMTSVFSAVAEAKGGSFGGGRSFSSFSSSRSSSSWSSSRSSSTPSRGWSFFGSSKPTPAPAPKMVYKPAPVAAPKPVLMQKPVAPVAKTQTAVNTPPKVATVAPVRAAPVKSSPAPMMAASGSTSSDEERRRREEARKRAYARNHVEHTTITHNPTYAASATHNDSGSVLMPMLVGGAIGYMIGGSGSGQAHAATQEEVAKYPVCPDPLPENWNTPCVIKPKQDAQSQPAQTQPAAQAQNATPVVAGDSVMTGGTAAVVRQ